MKNRKLLCIVASRRIFTTLLAASLLIANNSLAQLSIEFWEVGGNVVAQGSGTANLTRASVTGSAFISAYVFAANGSIGVGQTPSQPVTLLENAGGPGAGGFGNGPRVIADSGCGDPFSGNRGFIYIPQGYVSGTWLGGGGLWNNRNFASLGLNVGTYRWSWGSAADQKLTVSIGTTPIGPYWNGSGTAAWETETNWLNSTLPTTTAYLNNGSTISLTSAQSLESFFIGRACSGGTLLLGSGGNLTAPQIDVAFKRNTTGNLNFNGGTVTAPRIVFGSGNGAVNFNQAGALSLDALISGNGTVRQQGAGTTTLTANNTYTGSTAVSAGRLLVNGAHTGGQNYTVSGTGILGGIGTLSAGVVVNSGGTLSPGPVGAIGEFKIGSLTLNSGGALRFSLNGASASFLNVTGAVNLNGGVNFSNIANPTADLYPLLTAGTTLSGVFNPASIVTPLGYEIFYGDDNTVFLRKSTAPPFSASAVLPSGDALIVGGSLPFEVAAVNSGSSPVSFTAAGIGISNTTGSVPNTTVNGGDSTNAAGISFTSSTVGANQSGTFSVTSGGTTNNLSVSGISVYDHAAGSVVGGTTLGLAPVHVGYTSAGTSTNSITVSNAATNGAASLRANLGVTNNNTSLVSVLRGVAPGSTGALTGNLAAGLPVGQFSTNVTLTFFDDSTLPGALNSLGTTNITVTGYVYSGQGVWTAGSGGSWTSIGNWQVPGGIPGVDGALSLGDTATFGALGNGPVTLNTSAGLLSITFSNTSPYVVSGSGGISLAPFGGTNPSITSLAGSHTISNPISAQTMLNLSNAASSGVTLAGGVSGNTGINKSGAGTTTFGGTSTYVGATVINNGTLAVTGKMANNAANTVTVNSNASFVFANNDVFGVHSATVIAPIVINGGTVRNSGSFFNALGPITMNGGTLAALDTIFGLSFSLKGLVTVNSNSTISGPGISLGAAAVTGTTFNVANGANLTVDSGLLNGWSVNINPPNPSFLTKTGTGTMQLNGTNTYTGTTTISAGTLSLGGAGVLGGGNYSGSILNSGTLVVGTTANQILGGVISGSGALVKDAAGTLTLGGVNTYTGGTVVSNGTIAVTGTLANNAGNTITVNNGATFAFARNVGNTFGIHTANILTPMVINAGGLVTNSGTNFFSALGPITLNGGTLAAGTVGGPDGYSYALKGTVTVNSNSIISGPGISLGAGSVNGTTFNVASNATLTVNGGLTNGAGVSWPTPQPSFLTKTGAGTMQLNGTNTYTGTTTISAGTLSLGGAGVLGGGNYSGSIVNSGTFVVGTTANQILGGVISGSGALVKDATGTLTLDGVKTYTGTTTINAGTLLLNGEHTGGAGYTVNSDGTLGGLGSTTSAVTVQSGGNITPGAGSTEELIVGGLALNTGGTLNVFLNGANTSKLIINGDFTLNGGVNFLTGANPLTNSLYTFASYTGSLGGAGTFSFTNLNGSPGLPTGYELVYGDDKSIFLALSNEAFPVAPYFTGDNAVITGGTLPFEVAVLNNTANSMTFTAAAGTNTTGSVPLTTVPSEDSTNAPGLVWGGTNVGTNNGSFSVTFNGSATTNVGLTVLVYDHARGSLATNAVNLGAAIVGYSNSIGGSISVSNATGFRAPLGTTNANTNANLAITDARDIQAGTIGNLLFALTNQSAGRFTNNVTVTFFDDSNLNGASNNLGTTNVTVTGTIFDHASVVTNGTNLAFRPVHQNAGGRLISTNSISISNLSNSTPRVALGSENTYTNSGLTVGSVQDLAEGQSRNIGAVYDLDLVSVAGQFTNFVDVRFFDDSTLDGASTNVGTATIAVSGYVYTGKGIWTGNGTNWAAITNWLAPGGTPGLDGAFSVNDTATFDTNGTSYTVNLAEDAGLRAITFSNTANAYTVGGAGDISLTAASEGPAKLANLAGTHTISNNIRMGSTLEVTNATGTQLTLAGVLSGFNGFTKSGPGTLTLASANTYSGTTTVTGGTLQATTNGAFSSQSGVVLNGGTIDIGATTQVLPSLSIVTGTHNQTNGTLSVVTASSSDSLLLASQAGGTVVYNLSGGTLSTTNSNLQVGWLGNATFNQTGGTVDIDGYFVLGRFADSTGTYDLSAGTATQSSAARNMIIGEDGIGSMIVRGSGVLTDKGIIQLGLGSGRGTLTISNGGVVDAPGINLGTRIDNLLVFDIASAQTNFSVPITGAGSVVKAGSGTVVFDQNNSYGGTTTISNGTLAVNGIHANAGTYTVMNNAVLAGTGEINGFVSVLNGGTINPGVGGNNEEFKIGGLEIQSGGILNVVLGGATTSQLQVAGGVTLDPTSVVNFSTNANLTASLYPFLKYGGAISGTFGTTNNLPSGYEVIYDSDDKLIALLFSATNFAVAPVFEGENAVITGGTLPFNVFVYNNTVTNVAVTATGGTSTTGSASTNVPSETSDSLAGLTWTGATPGLNQTGNITAVFTPPTGPVQTNTVNVTVSVYDHASNVITGNSLGFAAVHARNTNPLATTNSITVSNSALGGPRVALGVTNINTNSAFIIDDVRNLQQGTFAQIAGLLEDPSSLSPGRFTNTVQLVSFDDSNLNGAITLATNNVTVTGYVYTGEGVWNTPGGGNWANISQWQVPGGTPGLDGAFSIEDTALFGTNGNGTVTNNGNVQLLSMTFSNAASPYTIGGTGSITLTGVSGGDSAITTLAGAHTISNAIEIGSDLVLSNATGTLLTLAKPVDGPFGLIKEGAGTTALSAANTYTGGTTVNGGQLNVAGTLVNDADNALTINGGIVALATDDVFGKHFESIETPIVINEGGELRNSGNVYNALGALSLNGGTLAATATHASGYSFSLKGPVTVTGTSTSTITGLGISLGADTVDSTTFDVAEGSTLLVTTGFTNGPSAAWPTSQPSRLVKDGLGEMIMAGNSSYTGGTFIEAGTLTTRTNNSLGAGTEVTLNGGVLSLETGLNIGSFVWDSQGQVRILDAVLDDVSLNIANNLTLNGGGPFNFDLLGNFISSDGATVMTAANMSSYSSDAATLFGVVGGLSDEFIFEVVGDNLRIVPNVLVVEGGITTAGTNNYRGVRYVDGSDPDLTIPVGSTLNITPNPVVMSNNSVTTVNGTFNAPAGFTVQSGSALAGTGTLIGNVLNEGLFSPGSTANPTGQTTVQGNFTQASTGATSLGVASASSFSKALISGTATLAGTLQVTPLNGFALPFGSQYQFLTADGGVSGTYSSILMPVGQRGRLLVNGTTASLLVAPQSYTQMALTPNQANVAAALDNFIGATGDRGVVSTALDGLSASQYPAAFEQMMPSQYSSLPSMAFNVVNALNSSMFQRLWVIRINGRGFSSSGIEMNPMQAEMGGTDDMGVFAINPSKDTKWSSFVDGNGVFANASSTGSTQNYRSQSGGVSTGAAYSWTDAFATGVYVGYQGLQAEYDNGRTIDNAVRFGVFGTYDIEDFYFNALVGGAYHGYTVNRYINFGGLNRTATGRPGAGEFDLALGTGYDFDIGNFSWGPFTTLQYTYLAMQGFTEAGADSLNLDVSPYDSSSLLYTLGAQAAYNWKVSENVVITPTAFAGWQHEFLQNGYTINSTFATGGPAAPFNYNTSSPARDNFYGGVGVTVGVGESWQATFIYSASAANQDNSSQNLYLGVGYKF